MDIFGYVNQTQAIISPVAGGSSWASYLASRCLVVNASKVCMYSSWHFFSLSQLSGSADELVFPYIPLDGCFWGRSLGAGSVRDAASSLSVQPPGTHWLRQAGAGAGLGAPAEKGKGILGFPGAAKQDRIPPAAWKARAHSPPLSFKWLVFVQSA